MDGHNPPKYGLLYKVSGTQETLLGQACPSQWDRKITLTSAILSTWNGYGFKITGCNFATKMSIIKEPKSEA